MLLSTKEVSLKLKMSEQSVRKLIRDGKLNSQQVGKQWVVESDDLQRFIRDFDYVIEPIDHERLTDELPDVIALSFFSGAMGLDIGISKAGIEPLLACEFDKTCRKTIQSNNPEIALIGDINDYNADEILKLAKVPANRKVDIIFGGPPCQAFSTAGNRKGFNDERGNVFIKYLELVSEIKPTYVVIENVRGLLSSESPYDDNLSIKECMNSNLKPVKGGTFLHIIKILKEIGYTISYNLYNAANFGSPQIRERVVLIGYMGDSKVPYLEPTHSEGGGFGLKKWMTLREAFDTLDSSTVHHFINFPEDRLVYYRMLTEGQYWKNLPLEMQKEALGASFYLGGGKTGFYRRLAFNKPSPTLVTHPAMPATDLAHPVEDRPLSVEEYKAIQAFPKEWKICGSVLEQYKQIGNAVPIDLGYAIGKTIVNHMRNIKPTVINDFPFSRYKNTDDISWEQTIRYENGIGGLF